MIQSKNTQKKRIPLKEFLEETIRVADPKVEHLYIKFPREEIIPVSLKETSDRAEWDYEKTRKEWKKHNKRRYSTVHTHPYNPDRLPKRKVTEASPLPSGIDLESFLGDDSTKTMAIAQQNAKTGEIEGYFVLKKTKRTIPIGISQAEGMEEFKQRYFSRGIIKGFKKLLKSYRRLQTIRKRIKKYSGIMGFAQAIDEPKWILQLIQKLADRYKLNYRFVPAEGYEVEYGIKFGKKERGEICDVEVLFDRIRARSKLTDTLQQILGQTKESRVDL